jgi:large subunit ribosomal protein L1
MSRLTKRQKIINEKVIRGKQYMLEEAVELLKALPPLKFNESIDVSVGLGIDPTKSDQMVRGAVVLPHGTGKTVRVAVFAQNEAAEMAATAGADLVGFEDLADKVKQGIIEFDLLIATPDAMRVVGQLGQILGPRGLMPNPKVGTVTQDVATAVKNAKSGQVAYRTDKGGIIHGAIGKINFSFESLKENLLALIQDLKRAKPSNSKGIYIKKVVLSSSMGPGLIIDLVSLGI